MGLSSNSIVHFTNEKSSLKGILSEGFKISFCRENLRFHKSNFVAYVPMISFCDTPLSQVKDHIQKYGDYGIGLTRDWAIRNRLNPVFYIEPGSFLAESYDVALDVLYEVDKYIQEDKKAEYILTYDKILDFVRYVKPYDGILERKGVKLDSYRFADEKEWRYVPPIGSTSWMHYPEAAFSDSHQREVAEKELSGKRLDFLPEDIRYIIIKDDSEIHEFIRLLDDVKGGGYSKRDVERLTTRIITADQIRTDF